MWNRKREPSTFWRDKRSLPNRASGCGTALRGRTVPSTWRSACQRFRKRRSTETTDISPVAELNSCSALVGFNLLAPSLQTFRRGRLLPGEAFSQLGRGDTLNARAGSRVWCRTSTSALSPGGIVAQGIPETAAAYQSNDLKTSTSDSTMARLVCARSPNRLARRRSSCCSICAR